MNSLFSPFRSRFCLFIPLAVSVLFPRPAAAGVAADAFRQDCHELSCGRQGESATVARLTLRSWVKGLRAAAAFNEGRGLQNDPLNSVFANAEDPVWCAGSVEKFLLENQGSFPDSVVAEDILPLWWISVHPRADARHKEALRERLLALKARKISSVPVRRFPRLQQADTTPAGAAK